MPMNPQPFDPPVPMGPMGMHPQSLPGVTPPMVQPGQTRDTHTEPHEDETQTPELFEQQDSLDIDLPYDKDDDSEESQQREQIYGQILNEQDPFGFNVEARLPKPLRFLLHVCDCSNVAKLLPETELAKIGNVVVEEYEIDVASRSEWEEKARGYEKLFSQMPEAKNTPWPGAANVKIPLILQACIQFAARAYPEIVKGSQICKVQVEGDDTDGEKQARADRISRHMSFQLLEEIEEWEDGTDRLLHGLPVYGHYFRKIHYDKTLRRPRMLHFSPMDVIVHKKAKNLELAPRVNHLHEGVTGNVVWERIASGEWLDVDIAPSVEAGKEIEETYKFLEQHRWLDLDGDGYKEPYLVTVHLDSKKVLNIFPRYDVHGIWIDDQNLRVLRIEPIQYFVKYPFIPNPDGTFYDLGYGDLLGQINELTNSAFNQALDAGTLQNAGGGFMAKGLRMKGGPMQVRPGQWQPVDATGADLKSGFFPVPAGGASQSLIALLKMLIEMGKEVGNLSEVLAGESPGSNVPATTTLALIEQGLKVYSAVYKRVYRSLTTEFQLLYALNARYLDDIAYYRFQDNQAAVARQDYAMGDMDVIPTADPGLATDIQRLARSQALLQIMNEPGMNKGAIMEEYLTSLKLDAPQRFMLPPQAPPPPEFIEVEVKKHALGPLEIEAKIRDMSASAVLKLAQAAALGTTPLEELERKLDIYNGVTTTMLKVHQATQGQQGQDGKPQGGLKPPVSPVIPPDMAQQAAAQDVPMPIPPQAKDEQAAAMASSDVEGATQ